MQNIINVAYLVASILFIYGMKGLTHPRTAVRGNLTGATGMLLAVLAVLLDPGVNTYQWIIIGLIVGGGVGLVLAKKVEMTGMPELVALFNGFGGLASILVAGAAVYKPSIALPEVYTTSQYYQANIATAAAGLIGGVTFFGSIIAFVKLAEIAFGGSVKIPGKTFINGLLVLGCIAFGVLLVMDPSNALYYWGIVVLASILGVTVTVPIGGADMPVVIALLNSYSGLAAAATGFVLICSSVVI